MEVRLDDKVLLITGSSQGIGAMIAELAARSGASALFLTDRQQEKGEAVARRIEALGAQTAFVPADLADERAPARVVGECLSRFGRIDGLVNAAALTNRASLLDGTLSQWDSLFAVNARAPFFLMQHAVKAMRESGRGGAIVNIVSMNAHCGTPELAIYSATKAALVLLTKNAANAHRSDRIRANAIAMGWTDTPGERKMQADILGKGPGWLDEAERSQPFGRLFTPADVANLAVFLLSDAGGPMTGAIIDQEQWVVGANFG